MAMLHEPENSEPVDRLYVRLAAALRQSRPNPFGAPVTVAEIYQELVPYRLVRTDAGFDMNADYEHALLRLLAGEGEGVRLEPTAARDAIRQELRSTNPNVGMYREYAGCDVWVSEPAFTPAPGSIFALADEDAHARHDAGSAPDRGPDTRAPDRTQQSAGAPGAGPASATDRPAGAAAGAADAWLDDDAADEQNGGSARRAPAESGPAAADAAAAPAESQPAAAGAAAERSGAVENCSFCDSPLPTHRPVRFCPWCGADQTTRPCASCGEPLEGDWLFCVACGARPGD